MKSGQPRSTPLYLSAASYMDKRQDVERIVNTIFNEITQSLADGKRVELRGFGAFSVQHRKERTGRNPRTGETVHVEEKFIPRFKTGKELRLKLNKHENNSDEG